MPRASERGGPKQLLIAARAGLLLVGSLATMAAGLILARRLSPAEYAAMQSLTKRVVQYVAMTSVFYEAWLIRDAVRSSSSIKSSVLLYGAISGGVGAVSGWALVYALTGSSLYSAIAFLAGLLLGARAVLGLLLDALRPVRAPLVILTGRLVYLGGVVGLVQVMRLGLLGALASFLARTLVMVAGLAYYARSYLRMAGSTVAGAARSLVRRARAGTYRLFSYLLPNIDVPLVISLAGSNVLISGFFVARLVPFTLLDIMRNTFRFLQAAFSRGWSRSEVESSIRLSMALAVPILMFSLVYSDHVICLINCEYLWATPMLKLFSVEAVFLLLGVSLENSYLGAAVASVESADEHARLVERLYKQLLPAYIVYPMVLVAAFAWLRGRDLATLGLAWAVSVFLMTASYSAVISREAARFLGGGAVLRLYSWTLAYMAVSLGLALLPWVEGAPSSRFLEETALIGPPAIIYYAVALAAIAVIDGDVRRLVREITRSGIRRMAV
ncbi:MAG: hypothetical protein F7C34_01900 [Desulfurococcales archaeon]|nr:hypothetical protein [Desulfurococcales archaeon]